MTTPALIKQVYWPADSDEQLDAKQTRLHQAMFPGSQRHSFPIEVIVKRHVKSRSPEASNYLWGVCYPLMADSSGYEKEELHDAMCRRYFGTVVVHVMGEAIEHARRTTTTDENGDRDVLGAADFWDFTDYVIREAATWFDVAIPPPDPEKRKR